MDDSTLFLNKVQRIVIMGGIEMDGSQPRLTGEGFLVPSIGKGGAANNNFDPSATLHLYDAMQRHGIPMTITTRFAAYGCKMPFGIFTDMSAGDSPIGTRIGETQAERIRELWTKAKAPIGSVEREDLPARCDRTWFVDTFCGSRDPGGDDILPYMAEVAWYDPLNLVASSDELRQRFFNPFEVEVKGVPHQIIGLTTDDHGVLDGNMLRSFMQHGVLTALAMGQTPIPVF